MNNIKELLIYLTNQFKFWFIIKEWDYGLQLRRGKIIRELDYGMYFKIPFFDSVYAKPKRIQDIEISQVNFTTKDMKQMTISANIMFNIINIKDYYNGYSEPLSIIDGYVKSYIARYFLGINYIEFSQELFENYILTCLKYNIVDKGVQFNEFKLTSISNARTYRLITDKLYSQKDSHLDKEIY